MIHFNEINLQNLKLKITNTMFTEARQYSIKHQQDPYGSLSNLSGQFSGDFEQYKGRSIFVSFENYIIIIIFLNQKLENKPLLSLQISESLR